MKKEDPHSSGFYPSSSDASELRRAATALARQQEYSLWTHQAAAKRLDALERAVENIETAVADLTLSLRIDQAERKKVTALLLTGFTVISGLVGILTRLF